MIPTLLRPLPGNSSMTDITAAKLALMVIATQAARKTGADLHTVQAAVTRYTATADIDRILSMIERARRTCEKNSSVPC